MKSVWNGFRTLWSLSITPQFTPYRLQLEWLPKLWSKVCELFCPESHLRSGKRWVSPFVLFAPILLLFQVNCDDFKSGSFEAINHSLCHYNLLLLSITLPRITLCCCRYCWSCQSSPDEEFRAEGWWVKCSHDKKVRDVSVLGFILLLVHYGV